MFQASDIYTAQGSVKLYNSWTPVVSKYDTSSFYNWEQDNLPLYDLEERTYELWEQAGFPTSSLNGLSLVVSADSPAASLLANRNIFTTVSACVASLPRVLRFPVVIEVANFNELGTLELNDIEMVENGSIEIINRNYGRVYSASADVTAVTNFENYALISQISSLDLSNTMVNASALAISALVYSGVGDVRLSSVNVAILAEPSLRKGHLTYGLNISNFRSGVANIFNTTPYDGSLSSAGGDTTVVTQDIVPLNQTDGTTKLFRAPVVTDNAVIGSFYGNKFAAVVIRNCNGPIYLRNFLADAGAQPHTKKNGILIENSNVVLENCAASRFEAAGFSFYNSKVILSRSAFAWRNYDLSNADYRQPQNITAGFKAVNSEITFSCPTAADTQAVGRDFVICASRNTHGFVLENSNLYGGLNRTSITDEQTKSHIQLELNTSCGLLAYNSHIDVNGLLDFYGNSVNSELYNSILKVNEFCADSANNQAIKADKSTVIYGAWLTSGTETVSNRFQTDLSSNGQAIVLDGQSRVDFNRRDRVADFMGALAIRNCHGYNQVVNYTVPAIEANGGSIANLIHLFNSRIEAQSTENQMVGYGVSLAALNGSVIRCFGSKNHPTILYGPPTTEKNYFLAGAYAKGGSELSFHGPTTILNFGVDALADGASKILFSPPYRDKSGVFDDVTFELSSPGNHTSVELHSLRSCLVAIDNSQISMDSLGHFARYWKNTTDGSQAFDIEDDVLNPINTSSLCGQGSMQFYPNPNDYGIMSVSGTGENGATVIGTLSPNSKMTVGNSTNYLLANNDCSNAIINWGNIALITSGGMCVRAIKDSVVSVNNVHFPVGSTSGPTDGIYYNAKGDDCTKLMIWNIADNSKLHASYLTVSALYPANVGYHGPSALYPSSVNGSDPINVIAYGAPLGTPDTGSLSVLDSFGAGSAVWYIPSGIGVNDPFNRFYPIQFSDSGGIFSSIAGAGMNTHNVAKHFYGASGNKYNNQGIFRIYFSPHSSAKFLTVNLEGYLKGNNTVGYTGVPNVAYQIFAQGYNMSGPCNTLAVTGSSELSSLFPNLLKISIDSNADGIPDVLAMSGFYYCSEFLDDNPSQCMLDESAANVFANAKNASYGRSGRPKRVTIYRASKSDTAGENTEGGTYVAGFKGANVFDLRRYS